MPCGRSRALKLTGNSGWVQVFHKPHFPCKVLFSWFFSSPVVFASSCRTQSTCLSFRPESRPHWTISNWSVIAVFHDHGLNVVIPLSTSSVLTVPENTYFCSLRWKIFLYRKVWRNHLLWGFMLLPVLLEHKFISIPTLSCICSVCRKLLPSSCL